MEGRAELAPLRYENTELRMDRKLLNRAATFLLGYPGLWHYAWKTRQVAGAVASDFAGRQTG